MPQPMDAVAQAWLDYVEERRLARLTAFKNEMKARGLTLYDERGEPTGRWRLFLISRSARMDLNGHEEKGGVNGL